MQSESDVDTVHATAQDVGRKVRPKCDPVLGDRIRDYLLKTGIETPLTNVHHPAPKDAIERLFREIMTTLGLDLNDDSLRDTPKRVAKMYVDEIFYGLDYDNFPKCTAVDNKMKYDEMIIVDEVNVQSNCEHHFVVIDGVASIAYIPQEKVLGLSKLNRIVEFFSKRPQIQERLTEQIYHALAFILQTDSVAVRITATHYCVKSRGVQDVNSITTTQKLGGRFRTNEATRNEFLNTVKK